MKVVLSKRACDKMDEVAPSSNDNEQRASSPAQRGVEEAIQYLRHRVKGHAGLIAIDKVSRMLPQQSCNHSYFFLFFVSLEIMELHTIQKRYFKHSYVI
jgi:hypothetical protein